MKIPEDWSDRWALYLQPEDDEFSDRPVEGTSGPYLGFLGDCNRVLDVGCGTGRAVQRLLEAGKDAYGVTFKPSEVEYAREVMGLDRLQVADMHSLPYEPGSFDAVISWDSLEHALAPLVALWEMNRVLRIGGKLLLFMPDQAWVTCPYHSVTLIDAQMRHLFARAGFRAEQHVSFGEAGVYLCRKESECVFSW